MTILSGQSLKGYEMHECIGQGAFGAVYRAYQPVIDREVAVKVILPQYANQPDFIRRFEVEAQLVARLEHLHIVPLYDYWRDPDGAYLVMRYLRGGSLKEWIAQGALDPGEALRLVEQIAQALAVAHRHGVVHRDIKPSNILLDEERNAYLADFGIAKVLGGEPSVEGLRGTLDYISPEQIRSQPVTAQTDVYALGIVLYEMLTGTQPFSPVGTPAELLHKHLEVPIPDVRGKRTELPGTVNDVIQTATAKTSTERYTDAPGLARALREALAAAELAPAVIEQPLIEPLTDRELDVLRLMAEGLSNNEIASRLVLALSTVKWYVQQVYGKLGVGNRRQAVAAGQRLGLLEGAARRDVAIPDWMVGHNPYKGLAAFQQADAPDFFGREMLVEQLVACLQDQGDMVRFLAVVGPSGSGKSSVVRAGLLPALKRGAVPGSENWFVVDMLPGAYPLDQLEVALGRIATQHLPGIMEQLQRDIRGLLRVADLILPDSGQLLLVIDQFEELFTLVEDPAVTRHVLDLIYAAVTDPRSRVRVMITLRADFYDRPLMYPDFVDLMRHRTEVVGPLTPEELEQAIVKPAEMAGVTVEPGLVAALVADVHEQPGTLPLLEYALTELFDRRQGRTMTLAAYQAAGGALGALTRQADEVYEDLSDAEQAAARQGFLRLVTLGEGTEDVRRRVLLSELSAITATRDGMGDVLDLFGSYRLLTFDCDPATREPTVEVAHEALIQRWKRLREWIDASRADIRQQRLLAAAAAEWEQAGREKSYLLTGSRLAQVEDWAVRTDLALTPGEHMFLERSVTEQAHQRARRRRIRNIAFGVMVVVALIVAALALVAFDRERQAQDARARAEREAAVNLSLVLASYAQDQFERGFSERALSLALESINIDDPPSASIAALTQIAYGSGTRSVLQGHAHAVHAVAFSPEGTIGLSGSCASLDEIGDCLAGEIIVWDLVNQQELTRLGEHTDWVEALVFQPGTTTHSALSAADDGLILLWDVNSGDILQRFSEHDGAVNTVAFSPDGLTFLSGGDDGIIRLWDVNSGDMIRQFIGHSSRVNGVVFRPGTNEILSVSSDFTLRSWELETGKERHQFNKAVELFCMGITPDGRTALVCADYGIGLWDTNQQSYFWGKLSVHSEMIDSYLSLSMSADGQEVMAGLRNGLVVVSNLGFQSELSRIELSDTFFSTVEFLPDERYLLLGTSAGTTILWDRETGSEVRRFEGQTGIIMFAESTPDGKKALIGSSGVPGGTGETDLLLWDIETGEIIYKLVGHRWYVRAMDLSPDGRFALTGSQPYPHNPPGTSDGELILWNLETGELVWRVELLGSVTDITFSADGRQALTASDTLEQPALIVWDIATGQPIREFRSVSGFGNYAVAYDADEKAVLTAEGTGTLTLRDLVTGGVIRTFIGHENWVLRMTLSQDKRLVLSGDDTGLIILWDFTTGQEMRRIQAHQSAIYWIDFTHDSSSAYTSGFGGSSVVQWQVGEQSLDELIEWIHENRYVHELSCAERAQYRIEPLCE